jgi:hypothetical protein
MNISNVYIEATNRLTARRYNKTLMNMQEESLSKDKSYMETGATEQVTTPQYDLKEYPVETEPSVVPVDHVKEKRKPDLDLSSTRSALIASPRLLRG